MNRSHVELFFCGGGGATATQAPPPPPPVRTFYASEKPCITPVNFMGFKKVSSHSLIAYTIAT